MLALFILFVVLAAVHSFRVPHLNLGGKVLNNARFLQKSDEQLAMETEARMDALFAEMEEEYKTRKIKWEALVAENMNSKKPKVIKPLKPMFTTVGEYESFLRAEGRKKLTKEDKIVAKQQKVEAKRKEMEEEAKSWDWSDSRNFVFTYNGKTDRYVPTITEPKWFAVDVTYSKVDDVIAEVQRPPFSDMVTASYCDQPEMELAFRGRGKNATLAYKEINPRTLKGVTTRVVYFKMVMNKAIESLMKTIDGVFFFRRTGDKYLVLPCAPFMQEELDRRHGAGQVARPALTEEQSKLRVGSSVEVIWGERSGQQGILEGVIDGKLRVRFQNMGAATISMDLHSIRRLETSIDKGPKATTVRQATEAIFARDPNSPMIRHMASMGLLNEVLFSDQPYLDEKMSTHPAKKLTTQRLKAQMPKGPVSLEDIDPAIFVARALQEREEQARNAALQAGEKPPKAVRMPRIPDARNFATPEQFRNALLEHDKKVRAISDATKAG